MTYLLIVGYFTNKNNTNGEYLLLEKDGITDVCDGSSIKFNWSIIKTIIIKDDIIIIIANHPVCIYSRIDNIDKFTKEIKHINKDVHLNIQ